MLLKFKHVIAKGYCLFIDTLHFNAKTFLNFTKKYLTMKDSLKIQKIEGLNEEQLSALLVKILLLQGFSNIQKLSDCIKGEQNAFLKVSQAIFITFSQKLSGNINIDEISGKIKSLRDKYLPNNIYVYSCYTISNGFQKSIATICGHGITFIDRDEFIQLIDTNFVEYWKHDDTTLLEYEKHYLSFLENDSELKRLSLSNDKYQKLSSIFIEPQLIHYYQDKKTNTPISKKYSVLDIINHNLPVVIDGYPGSGKSTLIKIILGKDNDFSGDIKINPSVKIGYIPQEIKFNNESNTILEYFLENHGGSETEARTFLAKYMFYGENVFKRLKELSGGERVRLLIAKLVLKQTNFLILDEPTNHLDISTRELLEENLKEYKGTILFVSHDRYFASKIAEREINI